MNGDKIHEELMIQARSLPYWPGFGVSVLRTSPGFWPEAVGAWLASDLPGTGSKT